MAPWTKVVSSMQESEHAVVTSSPPLKSSSESKKKAKVPHFCIISWAREMLATKPVAGPKRVEN